MTSSPTAPTDPSETCCSGHNAAHSLKGTELIDLTEALRRLKAIAKPIDRVMQRPLSSATGFVLSAPVASPIPLPIHDNSAVDGYAVRLLAIKEAQKRSGSCDLAIEGRVAAGDDPALLGQDASCVRILTGAQLPRWADAVIMQEDTELLDEGKRARFNHMPKPGTNIRRQGEDVAKGSEILASGTRLDSRHIAIAAAAGVGALKVTAPLRVAILATGSELNLPGRDLPAGGIYDSNTPMLASLLSRPDIELTIHHGILDDFETVRDTIGQLAEQHDLLVTSGGMSVSDEDHIKNAIEALGGEFGFHKLRIKPGKPLGVGTIGTCLFLGLPGNPYAALVGALLFGNLALDCLSGVERQPISLFAEADFDTPKPRSRLEFVPVRICGQSAASLPLVVQVGQGSSAHLLPLVGADGLAALPISEDGIKKGDRLAFYPFQPGLHL